MRYLAVTTFLATVTGVSSVFACSCRVAPPPKVALKQAVAVFLAKAVDVDHGKTGSEWTFEISRTWKGTTGKTADVHMQLSSCAYTFKKGKSYLVYCYRDKVDGKLTGPLRTNICMRTRPLEQAKDDLKELGPGIKP